MLLRPDPTRASAALGQQKPPFGAGACASLPEAVWAAPSPAATAPSSASSPCTQRPRRPWASRALPVVASSCSRSRVRAGPPLCGPAPQPCPWWRGKPEKGQLAQSAFACRDGFCPCWQRRRCQPHPSSGEHGRPRRVRRGSSGPRRGSHAGSASSQARGPSARASRLWKSPHPPPAASPLCQRRLAALLRGVDSLSDQSSCVQRSHRKSRCLRGRT
mmetsp:Transcript_103197/g.274390  ORF Transcript_103197/g.274390 Transcript_103197/m.274390 type:complete len:217 (+) Transcript_103197:1411-2061(+)